MVWHRRGGRRKPVGPYRKKNIRGKRDLLSELLPRGKSKLLSGVLGCKYKKKKRFVVLKVSLSALRQWRKRDWERASRPPDGGPTW